MSVSIVVPTYNERENIGELIVRLDKSLRGFDYEVVVVDDNSPDGTAEVAERLSRTYPVRVVRRSGKLGLASAVIEGIRVCRGDVVVVMDADLQHPPEVVPKLVEGVMEGNDVVIASRYVSGGSVVGWGLVRELISRVAVLLARLLIPAVRGIRDPVSGFFAIRRGAVVGVLSSLNPKGFKVLLEILARGRFSKVSEIPYEFRARCRGSSKLGVGEVVNYVLLLLALTPYLRVVKYMAVGGVGTVVNLGTLYVLRYLYDLVHVWASAVAIEVSILNNFILHELWTFRDRRAGMWVQRLVRFHGSTAVAVGIQYMTSQLLHYVLGVESVTAQLTGVLLGFTVNYVLSSRYIWRDGGGELF